MVAPAANVAGTRPGQGRRTCLHHHDLGINRHAVQQADGAEGRLPCSCRGTHPGPGPASPRRKVVKGRRWGGESDEWGVVEEVVRAVTLAEQLTDAEPGQLLFGSFQGFNSNGAMHWLRWWVTSPAGQRLGLEPIPDRPVHPRSLRGTLAAEMAARPGVLLATKLHFKHLSVGTSEGYAHRPGGAQAVFHQEWKGAEADEKCAGPWRHSASSGTVSCPLVPVRTL
ncbi:hypothetical protein ACIQGA_32265 [[Kitasatospora] papulosa]|uniref:hypothetical protein n=1 Tax=Streptomyces TaxID=1883 RepID=UPI0030D5C3C3